MPNEFINWQISERIKLFNFLKDKKQPEFFNPHLPTLLTIDKKKTDFLMNAACKGVGLVPHDKELEQFTKHIHSVIEQFETTDFDENIRKRIEGAMILYDSPEKIDSFALGGLEIFETRSFENILNNPFVSLFFVGASPQYKSYQINCIAEVTEKNHSFYKFMISMRNLFEEAKFHFQQPVYPYAIKYHVIEVLDKSLKVRGL